eukprot:gb/GFBE01061642.1/.p1 GENE.gb/GFBE01061642.1/~~gb/GFBE01061642.1/.p1  ORF type:complete len:277 (+),score=47.71 gb/GFBE01061642.1/:1-831(+)
MSFFSSQPSARQDYSAMQLQTVNVTQALDETNKPDGITTALSGMVRSESMDMNNDPRLFGNNVLMKRLLAFSALALVSSLMTKATQAQLLKLKKDIDLTTGDGLIQFASFILMNCVLFSNVLAMYVGVAQHYFTYRLMTAGPTGYEMASGYYLNPNIAFWRHAAIKGMLGALPLYLLSTALKLLVMFDQDMPNPPEKHPDLNSWALARIGSISVLGLLVSFLWFGMAGVLCYVDSKHRQNFRERYEIAKELERPLLASVSNMASMSQRGHAGGPEV